MAKKIKPAIIRYRMRRVFEIEIPGHPPIQYEEKAGADNIYGALIWLAKSNTDAAQDIGYRLNVAPADVDALTGFGIGSGEATDTGPAMEGESIQ